ncbi:MAG: hypothetical protein JNL28_17180 [Planctomycetes bacterium]|nr:hypothetical protein [Planctomycetota bacterium]
MNQRPRFAANLLGALALLALASCSALPRWVPFSPRHIPSAIKAADVDEAIQKAEAALERGDTETAIDWMRAATRATGMPVEKRDRVQILLETACSQRIAQLSESPDGADGLAAMVDIDLPRQLAVEAGLRAATQMMAAGDGLDAYDVLKKLDTKFPLHHERQRAGDLMCEIGLTAIADGPGFLGFFSTQDEGQAILEYVILNAPWARRCDEAYWTLTAYYEADRDWDLAIDRAEKLVLNHPGSALRPAAQAHVPHLRLASIKSPEYDRGAIQKARFELQEWLASYAGKNDLEERVRIDLGDALRRLSDNDMIVSRFYQRVDNAYGARTHAVRAIEEAREANDLRRVEAAEAWLNRLPAAAGPEAPAEVAP